MNTATETGAFTVNEFLAWAKIGRTKLYQEISAGRIVPRRAGRKVLIRRVDAEAWLNALPESDK